MGYKDYQPAIQPGFLRGPYGTAWGKALGVIKDYFSDLVKQGIQQRWAGLAQAEALAMIGAERGIPQGPLESTQTYVDSLLAAWQEWELAGTPWAILALVNFLGYPDVYVVCQNGLVYGPAGDVELPDPNAGTPGVPPAVTKLSQKWTFAVGSKFFESQGPAYEQALSARTWRSYWLPATVYASTDLVEANPPNGCWYENTGVGGASGSTYPVFPLLPGTSVVDGPNTWLNVGTTAAKPIGQSQGTVRYDFWSIYQLVFDPPPPTWTNVQNPPTPTSAPSVFEIAALAQVISSFGAAHATCAGFFLPGGGARASFGWPRGRTFYRDAGLTTPSADGLTTLWSPKTTIGLGDQRVPTRSNRRWYRATTPGITDYPEPTWPLTVGATVTDGSVVWTCEGVTNTYETGTTPRATTFQFVKQFNP